MRWDVCVRDLFAKYVDGEERRLLRGGDCLEVRDRLPFAELMPHSDAKT